MNCTCAVNYVIMNNGLGAFIEHKWPSWPKAKIIDLATVLVSCDIIIVEHRRVVGMPKCWTLAHYLAANCPSILYIIQYFTTLVTLWQMLAFGDITLLRT